MKENNKYSDILDYDWKVDSLTNRMPLGQRAKIFLPFSALTGYEEALAEVEKSAFEAMSETPSVREFLPIDF